MCEEKEKRNKLFGFLLKKKRKEKEREKKHTQSDDIIHVLLYMGVESSLIYCPIKPSIIRDIIPLKNKNPIW